MSRHLISSVAMLLLLTLQSGCSCWKNPLSKAGQQSDQPETLDEMLKRREELEKKKEEKPDFETTRLTVLPADDAPTRNLVKPGHWFNAVQTSKANNFDFPKADLEAQCVNRVGQPVTLPGTNFYLGTARPASLPKGEQRHFDILLFASKPSSGTIWFQTHLRPRGGGRDVDMKAEPTTTMKPYQYYMVVLAEYADNYQFMKSMRSVRPQRQTDDFTDGNDLDYHVKLPKGSRRVDLPSHPLTWSNIAYVVWDDFNPSILSTQQQRAMIDWLHWGGQLIVSGPRTLDLLASSPFAPYLPAKSAAAGELSDDAIRELNASWSFEDAGSLELADSKRPLTIDLRLEPDGRFVPSTANLVAEKTVGRGRVVVSSFSLPHEVFQRWDSFDSFFNSVLMGRPARTFQQKSAEGGIIDSWQEKGLHRDDPRITSQVRFFSRDAMAITHPRQSTRRGNEEVRTTRRESTLSVSTTRAAQQQFDAEAEPAREVADEERVVGELATQAFGVIGFANDNIVGVAGWNDDSDVSRAASEALTQSAGISVPTIGFIARVLAIYLVVLVPLNWLVFRLLGRVEWAWAAVPVIAIGGALTVVRVAQLDIGFARSRTEIAVVELQAGYERAHLTRYIGLYSSLSSRYRITGGDETSLMQPLASGQRVNNRGLALYLGTEVSLTGFSVLSNSTGLLHTEQMHELGGGMSLSELDGRIKLLNQTNHDLRDAAVIRRTLDDRLQVAWIGDLATQQQADVSFSALNDPLIEFAEWEQTSATRRDAGEGELNIRRIFDVATDPQRLGLGETVLVGWNDELLDGMSVRPAAAQVTACTVFVAQLNHALRPQHGRDTNPYARLLREKRQAQQEDREDVDATF